MQCTTNSEGSESTEKEPENEDWFVECSDEEKYVQTGCDKGQLDWRHKPQDVRRLVETFDQGGVDALQLSWKCQYGRRPPTPTLGSDEEYTDGDENEGLDGEGDKAISAAEMAANWKNFDFDADEDPNVTPSARRPNLPGSASRELKGSARKKTTELSNIISKMERNRLLDARERMKAKSNKDSTPTQ